MAVKAARRRASIPFSQLVNGFELVKIWATNSKPLMLSD